jgi:hypothetical protein
VGKSAQRLTGERLYLLRLKECSSQSAFSPSKVLRLLEKAIWRETQMTFLKTVLMAAALALPITATQAVMTDITAEAAAKKPAKAKKVTKAKKAKKAKKVSAKNCGEFKYTKGGKCLDARSKKSSDS